MSRIVLFAKTATSVPVHEKQEIANGANGFRWVEIGKEEVFFETTIEMSELLTLGRKAARNKTGKATDGPLQVRVISRRRV